ncbi:pilus assembly protein [Streptomyces sp. NPDC052396]|uniref:pilus assembly protein n=1 Tax=Streptomyces sp. NPDC052396 TaxID=3365689 RepID=UPI0037D4A7DB
MVLVALAVVWQCVLVGYTYSLAGHAADRGARAQATGRDCRAAVRADLPADWPGRPRCEQDGASYKTVVVLKVPLMLPGHINWPWPVRSSYTVTRDD